MRVSDAFLGWPDSLAMADGRRWRSAAGGAESVRKPGCVMDMERDDLTEPESSAKFTRGREAAPVPPPGPMLSLLLPRLELRPCVLPPSSMAVMRCPVSSFSIFLHSRSVQVAIP